MKQAQLLDAWAQYPLDYTLLAPDNAAFEAFKAADGKLFEALMEDDGWVFHLQWILLYHVVEKKMWSDDLKDGDELTMYTTEVRGGATVHNNQPNTLMILFFLCVLNRFDCRR